MSIKEQKIKEQEALLDSLHGDLHRANERLKKAQLLVRRHRSDTRSLKKRIAESKEWLAALTETVPSVDL